MNTIYDISTIANQALVERRNRGMDCVDVIQAVNNRQEQYKNTHRIYPAKIVVPTDGELVIGFPQHDIRGAYFYSFKGRKWYTDEDVADPVAWSSLYGIKLVYQLSGV